MLWLSTCDPIGKQVLSLLNVSIPNHRDYVGAKKKIK